MNIMEENLFDTSKIEKKMHSIGIDIDLIISLIKSMDISLNEDAEFNTVDLANLTHILKRLMLILKKKHDKIERVLNI